jgi:hypothetical protein
MSSPNDKRTHWYENRNKFGQRLRFCNNSPVGIFVTENNNPSKAQVDCTLCVKQLEVK